MGDLKDFTPLQARRWVSQEASKHLTAESREDRLRSERRILGARGMGAIFAGLPNSRWAHVNLVNVLEGGAD